MMHFATQFFCLTMLSLIPGAYTGSQLLRRGAPSASANHHHRNLAAENNDIHANPLPSSLAQDWHDLLKDEEEQQLLLQLTSNQGTSSSLLLWSMSMSMASTHPSTTSTHNCTLTNATGGKENKGGERCHVPEDNSSSSSTIPPSFSSESAETIQSTQPLWLMEPEHPMTGNSGTNKWPRTISDGFFIDNGEGEGATKAHNAGSILAIIGGCVAATLLVAGMVVMHGNKKKNT